MFENINWESLGVFVAVLILVVNIYQAYQKYIVPKKEKEKETKKKRLEKELSNVRQFTTLIKRNLEERTKNNSFPKSSNVNLFYTPSGFKEKGEKYDEKYDLCIDLKEACKSEIIIRLQELTKEHLPLTCKEFNLVDHLNYEDLTNLYMNKKEVTTQWIKKEYPKGLNRTIMTNLKDKEENLDYFFIKLNETFRKDPVLERFRKEKANLIELGNEILNELIHKEEELKKELEDFT